MPPSPGQKEELMAADSHTSIESHLDERRVFPPPAEFSQRAHVKSMDEYESEARRAAEDPLAFWAEQAKALDWIEPWREVLVEDKAPFVEWYKGGKLNLSANC